MLKATEACKLTTDQLTSQESRELDSETHLNKSSVQSEK